MRDINFFQILSLFNKEFGFFPFQSPIFRSLSGGGEYTQEKKKNITVQKIFFNCLIIQIKGEALTTGLQYIHIPHHHKLTLEYSKVKLPFIETKIQG